MLDTSLLRSHASQLSMCARHASLLAALVQCLGRGTRAAGRKWKASLAAFGKKLVDFKKILAGSYARQSSVAEELLHVLHSGTMSPPLALWISRSLPEALLVRTSRTLDAAVADMVAVLDKQVCGVGGRGGQGGGAPEDHMVVQPIGLQSRKTRGGCVTRMELCRHPSGILRRA